MIAEPDDSISHAALQKVLIAASDIDAGVVKHELHRSDSYYVYGYFEAGQPLAWQNAFRGISQAISRRDQSAD